MHPGLNRVLYTGKIRKQQVFAVGDHFEELFTVAQAPFPNELGFSREVTPNMENITPGGQIQTVLAIETDVSSEGKL
jgi:hypothetical protein